MAKTYGELILECQNFQYSKENYELTKECYELDLMNKYLESQQFMMESMDDIREEFQEFDESFFIESVDDTQIDLMLEKSMFKSENIFQKIWKGIKDIWKKITRFFAKLFGKYKKTNEIADKVKDGLEKIPDELLLLGLGVTVAGAAKVIYDKSIRNDNPDVEDHEDEQAALPGGKHAALPDNSNYEEVPDKRGKQDTLSDSRGKQAALPDKGKPSNRKSNKPAEPPTAKAGAIKKILEEAWKEEYKNEGYVIADNQPFANRINKNILRNKKYRHSLNMLAVALSTDTIVVKTTGPKKIMSMEKLIEVFDLICTFKDDANEKDVNDIKKIMRQSMGEAMHKGIVIKLGDEDIDKNKAKLDEITAKMNEFMAESVDMEMFMEMNARQAKKARKSIEQGKPNRNGKQILNNEVFKQNQIDKQKNIAQGITGFKEVYTDVIAVCGNIMKLYNDIESYRASVNAGLDKYLKTVKPTTMVS